MTGRCPACRRPVIWTTTEAGRRLAVDPQPDQSGNTAAYRDGIGTWRSRRPTDELPLMSYERLYKPHVATCPSLKRPTEPAALPDGVTSLTAYRRNHPRRNTR